MGGSSAGGRTSLTVVIRPPAVRRLSQRLGLTKQEDPVKIERDLQRLVPRAHWGIFPHLLIWHGRRVCIARDPQCGRCVLSDLCPAARVDSAG